MELWKKIVDGDEQALVQFCDAYGYRLSFICYKRGVPREDCPDLAQEVVAAAACQIKDGKFRGDSSVETWMMRILQNKIADYWRKKGREVSCVSLETFDDSDKARIEELILVEANPELPVIIEQALNTLPEEHRLLLLLNAMEGYTAREIAPLVGRSEGRVGALIAEAKAMFRVAIQRSEGNPSRKRLKTTGE